MKIGQRFTNNIFEYTLLAHYATDKVVCACLDTGIAFSDFSTPVKNTENITKEEFEKIAGIEHTAFNDLEGNPLYEEPVDTLIRNFIISVKDETGKTISEKKILKLINETY